MGMHDIKVRFTRRSWELIREEAAVDGVSASQFIREAALARTVYMRTRRGEIEAGEIQGEIVRLMRVERQKPAPDESETG